MTLLHIIQKGAQLFQSCAFLQDPTAYIKTQKYAHSLLESAQSFDPVKWAMYVQERSPKPDLELRTHIASAHHAATCIYLSRIVLTYGPSPKISKDLETSLAHVHTHISMIPPSNPLFAATAWPSFIAGAEAMSMENETWARYQFQKIWEIQPWGLIRGGLAVLEMIWARRRDKESNGMVNISLETGYIGEDWIGYIKEIGVDWLIL